MTSELSDRPEEPTRARQADTPIRLHLAAHQRYIRVARAVATSLAASHGFDVDEIDDLRIAVDELCNALLGIGNGSEITLEFSDDSDGEAVVVTGSSPILAGSSTGSWSDPSHDLARQILDVVAGEYDVRRDGDRVAFRLRQRRKHGR